MSAASASASRWKPRAAHNRGVHGSRGAGGPSTSSTAIGRGNGTSKTPSGVVPPNKKTTTAATKNAVTPDPRRSAAGAEDPLLRRRVTVDKDVVDELLLVCGVIGTATDGGGDSTTHTTTGGGGGSTSNGRQLVPVTDCLNWLQDLQRALRRDDDHTRPISLLLSDWRVVPHKLIPLALTCRYDNALVLTICKILVILTKPLSDQTVNAGRMIIDTHKTPPEVVQQQILLRDNALKQADAILEYKRILCHHSSHRRDPSSSHQGGLLSVFVALLAEPLSRTGTSRTDSDHLAIELVLHLVCNLLRAEPLIVHDRERSLQAKHCHHEFVAMLERELVLDIVLVVASDLEARENAPYNLLLLEVVHHLFRDHDPTAVARGACSAANNTTTTNRVPKAPSHLLRVAARKDALPVRGSTRHGHFAGTLAIGAAPGGGSSSVGAPLRYVSAARWGDPRGGSGPAPAVAMRKHKRTDPFVGGSGTSAGTGADVDAARGGGASPAQMRAWTVLDQFCRRFCADCYGGVLKSWKNEFRRDSVRLQHDDLAVFFRIVWFLKQWRRASGSIDLGPFIFTMDVFTFNLVLNATDSYTQRKQWGPLSHAIALLGEMMHWLVVMDKSEEPTERLMAVGLMDRLFYASEPLDRLPRLLAKWEPGTTTRRCLADLVELAHVTMKLLDANAKRSQEDGASDHKDSKKKHDTVAKMQAAAADFDVAAYFARKLVSNHIVYMYTQLLSQYATNAAHTNHRLLAFFLRLSKFAIAVPDEVDGGKDLHPLPTKRVTLEPMLYSVQMLVVLDKILNDRSIRDDPKFESLLTFATSLVTKFAKAAQHNPLLFVEALVRHPVPYRFCELSTHLYVGEELRMMAERDLLLEQSRHLEAAVGAGGSDDDEADDDESDEELEFEDFGLTAAPNKPVVAGGVSGGVGRDKTLRDGTKLRGGLLLDDSSDDDSRSSAEERASKKPKLAEGSATVQSADNGVGDDEGDEDGDGDDDGTKRKDPTEPTSATDDSVRNDDVGAKRSGNFQGRFEDSDSDSENINADSSLSDALRGAHSGMKPAVATAVLKPRERTFLDSSDSDSEDD